MSDQSDDGVTASSGEKPIPDRALVVRKTLRISELETSDISNPNTSAFALPGMSMGIGSPPAARSALEPPKLDGYTVLSAIGEGGMGTVWRAVQLSTRREVALKLMSAAGFGSERARQRFDREVEITARLEHPHIARVYDSGINRGVYFYAMELIEGLTLDQYVTSRHLGRVDILRLFALVCGAVDHAHQRGVIHRDLKPGNILVTPDGQPHVLDFGLAKALLEAGKEAGISLDGEVAGTPGFMSPEQAAGKPDLDARTDVYALGVILYRLLTGQSPHDLSGTYLDVLRRVSEEEPKRPRLVDHTVDRELEAILLRALQRNPSERYRTAGNLAQDVASYLRGDPIAAKAPTTVYYLRKRVSKHRVKITTLIGLLALLTIAASLTVNLTRSKRETLRKEQENRAANLRATQENRAKEIADGNNAVFAGDQALASQKWIEAKKYYREAAQHFNSAKASSLKANLGLWDVTRLAPEPMTSLSLRESLSTAPAFLNDNRRLLIGSEQASLILCDVATGQTIARFPAHRGPIRSVAVSHDGAFALTGADGGELKLWNLNARQLKSDLTNSLSPLKNRVTRVTFSPDGRYAVSASGASAESIGVPTYNDTLTLWDIKTARPLLTSSLGASVNQGVLDVKGIITQVAFSPDSTRLLAASAEVTVWTIPEGKRTLTLPHSGTAAAFSTDGSWLVAGSSDGSVWLQNFATQQLVSHAVSGNSISALWFDPRRDLLITGTEDGAFRATDSHGLEQWTLPSRGEVNTVGISPDGTVGITSRDEGLDSWRLMQPLEARDLAKNGPFPNVALSQDGRVALSRSVNHDASGENAAIWDTKAGRNITPAAFPTGLCNGIALSRDGHTVARAAGTILSAWSLDPPHEVRHWEIKPARSNADPVPVALSGDGTKVAVAAPDHSIWVNDVVNVSEPVKLLDHTGSVTALCFSKDGRLLLSGSDDATARLWDADTGKAIAVLRGHEAPVNALALSEDGKLAVTGSGAAPFQAGNDNTVRVWQIPSGKLLNTFGAQSKRVRSVAVSSDGSLIASGGDDKTVTLWDGTTGDVLRTIHVPHGPVLSLSFDATGQSLLCGSDVLSLFDFRQGAK